MLKKLAKYGNSTTLVIDKAILELLNMNESSIVKLQTDGKSLIITPVESKESGEKVSYTDSQEAVIAARDAFMKGSVKPEREFSKEEMATMKKEFADLFEKYREPFYGKFGKEIMPSAEFQEAIAKVAEKIDPAEQPEKYMKEYNKVKVQFCPELDEMDKEMEAINKKYM